LGGESCNRRRCGKGEVVVRKSEKELTGGLLTQQGTCFVSIQPQGSPSTSWAPEKDLHLGGTLREAWTSAGEALDKKGTDATPMSLGENLRNWCCTSVRKGGGGKKMGGFRSQDQARGKSAKNAFRRQAMHKRQVFSGGLRGGSVTSAVPTPDPAGRRQQYINPAVKKIKSKATGAWGGEGWRTDSGNQGVRTVDC